MKISISLIFLTAQALAALLFSPGVQAHPNTSIKNTFSRTENSGQKAKNKLLMPYAFSTERMVV